MKIKQRLITAFIIMSIIPITMIFMSFGAIVNYQKNSVQESYEVESDTLEILVNPVKILNRVTRGVYNSIKNSALKEPEKFEDLRYIKQLNSDLEEKYSFLVLRKDHKFIFSGNHDKLDKIKNSLPEFRTYEGNIDGAIYVGGKNPFLVKEQDFYFSDGSEGSAFIITDVNTILPQIKASAVQIVMSIIITICFTGIILILWIYRGLLRPLNTLRIATNQIRDGNLDYSIRIKEDDEIGVLCEDFEKMRIKLKELMQERIQYEEDTRELISNISHDLKTPLTAIKGYAEGIMDGVADTKEKKDKYLKTIYTKANAMTSLVDELSLYSKIDCNTMPYDFLNINLERYFNDCINELTLDLEVKNIDLAYFNYADSELNVVADAEQLKRVINNIIGNSAKYIGRKKGIINIRIREANEFLEVEIEDNGKGISKEDLGNIFDRFYRTDVSRNSSKGGSGLGLAISKKIIEDHGGKIWASSKEKVGTSIFFTLKRCDCNVNLDLPSDDTDESKEKTTSFGSKINKFIKSK
jgi:signal transduction histidine kinase